MATLKWVAPESITTALSTQLNNLSNGSTSSASSAIDNETDLYQFLNVELYLASLTPTGSPTCSLILLPTMDGTNYSDADASTIVAVFGFTTATAAKRTIRTNILIPPLKFTLSLANDMGASLAASGSTLKYRRHNGQSV